MPVEEPSTASEAEVARCWWHFRYVPLPDIGPCERNRFLRPVISHITMPVARSESLFDLEQIARQLNE